MSKKQSKIEKLLETCHGQGMDAHYVAFFKCFNEGLFFEAHDVLEELWLRDRKGPNYSFHKGLIQLAGAFVHLQKNRLRPSAALFKLALANIEKYPPVHDRLDLKGVISLIEGWLARLEETGYSLNPLGHENPPRIGLMPE